MKMREHHRKIAAIFEEHGIKPVIELTKSDHVRFCWSYGGKDRTPIITSKTPSDHRATDNAIARVYKAMRDAGVKVVEPDNTAAEIAAIQKKLAEYNEMLAGVHASIADIYDRLTRPIEAERMIADINAQIIQESIPVPPAKIESRQRAKRMADTWLFRALRYDEFLSRKQIAEASGMPIDRVSVRLSIRKKEGLVEHRPDKGWRKHRSVEQLDLSGGR